MALNTVKTDAMPKHVALILDGNRRWAKAQGLPERKGWEVGAERLYEIVRRTGELGIGHLTVFALSSENFNRPRMQISMLLDLLVQEVDRRVPQLVEEGVKLRFIGSHERLTRASRQAVARGEKLTGKISKPRLFLQVALDFSGRWDLLHCARALATRVANGDLQVDDIDEHALTAELSLGDAPPVDFLIRTGKEVRISNFLLWDIAYSELFFSDLMWPEFNAIAYEEALRDYGRRTRRIGR